MVRHGHELSVELDAPSLQFGCRLNVVSLRLRCRLDAWSMHSGS